MLASNRVECCPERFQMQAATVKRKIQLAQLWESLAGRQKFRHFMIFEHDSDIEGAHGLGHALELIKQL